MNAIQPKLDTPEEELNAFGDVAGLHHELTIQEALDPRRSPLSDRIALGRDIVNECKAAGFYLRREPKPKPGDGFGIRVVNSAEGKTPVSLTCDLQTKVREFRDAVMAALASVPSAPVHLHIEAIGTDLVYLVSDLSTFDVMHAGDLVYRGAEFAWFLSPSVAWESIKEYHIAKKRLLRQWDGCGWRHEEPTFEYKAFGKPDGPKTRVRCGDCPAGSTVQEMLKRSGLSESFGGQTVDTMLRCGVLDSWYPDARSGPLLRIVPGAQRERFVMKSLGGRL